ncbi:Pectinesterase inhibitor domain [Dillenia turbinata]|uniref:Pectinesterase inhibitor domain n=1 Tax=Dillenia turbinata TaxID=194707 RepID=A0AAN8W883_9MAGN
MKSLTTFFFILPLLCIATAINPEIVSLCEKSQNKAFCVAALESDPVSQGQKDLTSFGIIAIELAIKQAVKTTAQIKTLLQNTTELDPAVEDGLRDCTDFYTDATAQLDDSLAALTANAYDDVMTWIKTAVKDAESCESSLGELSPLKQANANFKDYCNINIVTASLIVA